MGDILPTVPVTLPVGAVARGMVVAPPSKSHAIRVLVCAALWMWHSDEGGLTVSCGRGPLPDDVVSAGRALGALGWDLELHPAGFTFEDDWDPHETPVPGSVADVGGSATAFRFLAAVAALGRGPCTLTGSPQLLRRPAGAIVDALRSLGVVVNGSDEGSVVVRPPLELRGGPPRGGDVEVDGTSSSHAVSALLLIAPLLERGLHLRVRGTTSRPYIDLTVQTMRRFGAVVEETADGWAVPPTARTARPPYDVTERISVEADWSSAAFLLGAAAATGGDVTVQGLDPASVQADRRVAEILRAFDARVDATADGVRATGRVARPVDVDLRDAPDLAPLVGALACLVPGTSRVRGAAHLRIKETDRIAEVVRCARAWGCGARELPDGFEIDGGRPRGATIHPAGDHRLAMAFAVAGLAVPGTRIAEPECVAKSYPAFWQDLAALTESSSQPGGASREPA